MITLKYYTYEVEFHHIGANLPYSSATSGSQETKEDTIAELIKTIQYYDGLGDVQITKATLGEICAHCNGCGTIWQRTGKSRVGKNVRCPHCKGKDSETVIETWIDLPKELFK